MDSDNSVVMTRGKGGPGVGGGGKRGWKMGTSIKVSTIKTKKKILLCGYVIIYHL